MNLSESLQWSYTPADNASISTLDGRYRPATGRFFRTQTTPLVMRARISKGFFSPSSHHFLNSAVSHLYRLNEPIIVNTYLRVYRIWNRN